MSVVSVGAFAGVVLTAVAATVTVLAFSLTLPDPSKVVRRDGLSTIIFDRNGKTLYDLYNKEYRVPLEFTEIPQTLKQATVAIEDKDFFKHKGLDPLGFLRIIKNLVVNRTITGGSTLTQQLVKTVLLSSERTVTRKIKEALLAYQIENKFSKDQILQMYLNEAPYGGATYGVESASQTYFGKSAKELNLTESAILAGLPQQPTNLSPFGTKPLSYINRTKDVLRRMREDGDITSQQEYDAWKQLPYQNFATQSGMIKAPHFVFYIKEQLVARFGEQMVESGGLRVATTLDWDLQKEAEKIVNEEIKKIKNYKVGNGAAVILNPKTGEILSMVGSYDYFDKDYGSFNVATALRQPGSSGKPFIYATALAKGYTASTVLMDVKTDYPSGDPQKPIYTPENYDLKYRGPMQLRFSLGNSTNVIAVKLTALAGVRDIMATGFNAGITSWEPTAENMRNVGLSLALGGREVRLLELAGAYGVLANGGVKAEQVAILKVTDSKGKSLYEYRPVNGKKVLTPEAAFIISHILADNNARKDIFGENSLLMIPGRTVAVKTGTTDQKRDNWTVGYTPSVVVGAWVGNNDNSMMNPAITSGVTGAAPIWNKIMRVAIGKTDFEEFKKPENVLTLLVDSLGGGLPHGSDLTRAEYFIKGTEPIAQSAAYKSLKVSKSNGKLANDLEIKAGQYEEKDFIVFSEDDPKWQEAINKWVSENKKDDSKWHPPTEISDAKMNEVVVNVETPQDRQRIDGTNEVQIKARAYAVREIVKFTLEVDGSEKINKGGGEINEKVNLTNGPHELKFKAIDSGGNSGGATIKIGVNANWDSPATISANFLTFF